MLSEKSGFTRVTFYNQKKFSNKKYSYIKYSNLAISGL